MFISRNDAGVQVIATGVPWSIMGCLRAHCLKYAPNDSLNNMCRKVGSLMSCFIHWVHCLLGDVTDVYAPKMLLKVWNISCPRII